MTVRWFLRHALAALLAFALCCGANAALRMPLYPPSYGFMFTNAFGDLTFDKPVAIVTPPGETNRLFVVEQFGRIAVITNLAQPTRSEFLDLSSTVLTDDEQGLLGLAFHPGYATNRVFYIFYTTTSTSDLAADAPHDRLSQWHASDDPNVADPDSEVVLIDQFDDAPNHNAGDLHFGPDGYLYVSLGDEGGADDNRENSQHIDKNFFSGIIRIDVDNRPGSLMPNPHPANTNNPVAEIRYRIPPDNPWVGATSFNGAPVDPTNVRTEFYAVGLRNPWRFNFDPLTGDLYLGDVGQDDYEEVDLVRAGGNYGWNYREGLHRGPRSSPPPGVVFDNPIVEYTRGSGTNNGYCVIGGVVYRGSQLPTISGAYVFADFGGNIWALRANGTNRVPFWLLTEQSATTCFGIDPRDGSILAGNLFLGILRLVEDRNTEVSGSLPPTLADTGAFTNLDNIEEDTDPLLADPGLCEYQINVPFWSDNAIKHRWVFRTSTNAVFGFSKTGNWSYPTGTVWVKHFDLEITNGVPSSARRLETRFLVKNAAGIYGATYRWDELRNASLVPDGGFDESFEVYDGSTVRTQQWHYPSRTECVTCHTPVAGYALGFNTGQLNREVDFGSGPTNQLLALQRVGYLSGPLPDINLLPALAHPTNTAWSREWRVRSFLAANCSQCHQPGGAGMGSWDARYTNPLSAAGLIRGHLNDDRGDSQNRVIAPGDLNHSMLFKRVSTRGQTQMPPLATTVLDTRTIDLLSNWITEDLPAWQSFRDWQLSYFGSTNAPGTRANDDPDGDSAPNSLEWLTHTDPRNADDFHSVRVDRSATGIQIRLYQVAGRGFELQSSPTLAPASWQPLNIPANKPFFSATDQVVVFDQPITNTARFYRVRVFEP